MTGGNFNAMSIPFTAAGADVATLADCFAFANPTAGESADDADTIQVWDPAKSGYDVYYLWTGGGWWNTVTWEAFGTDYPNGLPAGNFAWYLAQPSATAQTVTFKNPVQ